MLKKFKAFMIANVILALVATSVFAFSLMVTVPSMFGSLDAERVAAQAMQYAETEANIVKLLKYEDLTNNSVLSASKLHTTRQTLNAISVSGWEDKVTIGSEKTMGDGNKYRIAQIDIYKKGDTVPRATLNVPLSSQGSVANKIESGSNGNGRWIKLSDGTVLQFGYVALARSNAKLFKEITFPIPFEHECTSVIASQELYQNTDSWTGESVKNKNRFGFKVEETIWNGELRNIQGFNWIAFGY